MHDSGERRTYATGAVRDAAEGKPIMTAISPYAEARLADWLTLGAKKYSLDNWTKGLSMRDTLDSLLRHINKVRLGDTSEDNLAAIAANSMFLLHFDEMIKRGWLPKELNDLPTYGRPETVEVAPDVTWVDLSVAQLNDLAEQEVSCIFRDSMPLGFTPCVATVAPMPGERVSIHVLTEESRPRDFTADNYQSLGEAYRDMQKSLSINKWHIRKWLDLRNAKKKGKKK